MTHTITLKELRPELPKVVDKIDRRFERYIITKHGKPMVVMLSIDDYESMIETLEIMSDAKAMKGIRKGERDIRLGRTISLEDLKKKHGKL